MRDPMRVRMRPGAVEQNVFGPLLFAKIKSLQTWKLDDAWVSGVDYSL